MPHPTLGILHIPLVTRDDVDMDVEDTLPGRGPHIDADIVAIRAEFRVQLRFFLLDEGHAGSNFFRRQVEKAGDMPARDDQGVSWARRIGIAGAVGQIMQYRNALRVLAE